MTGDLMLRSDGARLLNTDGARAIVQPYCGCCDQPCPGTPVPISLRYAIVGVVYDWINGLFSVGLSAAALPSGGAQVYVFSHVAQACNQVVQNDAGCFPLLDQWGIGGFCSITETCDQLLTANEIHVAFSGIQINCPCHRISPTTSRRIIGTGGANRVFTLPLSGAFPRQFMFVGQVTEIAQYVNYIF